MASATASKRKGFFSPDVCDDFMAFLGDENELDMARQIAAKRAWPAEAVRDGGMHEALGVMKGGATARVVLVDVTGSEDPIADVERLSASVGQGASVIVIGKTNDVSFFHDLIEVGAADYLVKPINAQKLEKAIDLASQTGRATGRGRQRTGRLTVVLGVRGGVGATTIATNIAWIMAHQFSQKTALLDLDLHFGTTTLSLDLEPGNGLREALASPHRLDELFVASAIVKENDNLSVLGTEEPVEEAVNFSGDASLELVKQLRGNHSQVVVDLPRALMALQKPLLAAADSIVLVSDQTLAGIRDINRALHAIADLAGETAVIKVAARVGADRKAQVAKKDFERGIGCEIDYVVPEDAKTLTICANAGKAIPAVSAKCQAAVVCGELAHRVSGYREATPKRKGLFGLGGGSAKPVKSKAAKGKK
ncbi:AAA family ATPase [Oceanibacterium hippocampi]|uniref:CobQ/CobB/MinD/ParA nucleotide binding domain protein n=1 Tax=Oceanibacterium hippocampi TaxID=745714 RepID=A0A1Y5SBL0_9PROT|nr:AAA family ATPase [Oceanibacterium hippocampi]SLN36631.1 CobQ/CobB/MinD/ParA nucleotide binding domain protein [Oceanibacterium hippocampi]